MVKIALHKKINKAGISDTNEDNNDKSFLTADDASDKDLWGLMSLKSEVCKWDLVSLAEGFFPITGALDKPGNINLSDRDSLCFSLIGL